jgi:hypothetical protein
VLHALLLVPVVVVGLILLWRQNLGARHDRARAAERSDRSCEDTGGLMHVRDRGAGVADWAPRTSSCARAHGALYEAGDELGGQVRTFEIGGGRIESFYHHLFRSDTVIAELINELGLGADLEWIDSKVGFLTDGRIFPFVSATDLLRYSPVSLITRVRLGLAALWLRRQSDWKRYEGMRARDWIVRYVGREAYDRVWGALLRAKFGAHAEDVSMVWFWGKIYLRFASRPGGVLAREQLGYLRGSFGRLVDAAGSSRACHGGQHRDLAASRAGADRSADARPACASRAGRRSPPTP